MTMALKTCRRGEIYWADLNPVIGHEQGGRRPVLIIQNDIGNRYSSTTIVAPITSSLSAKVYPTEVRIPAGTDGLTKDSSILLNQIKAIDKRRLERRMGQLDETTMHQVNQAITISLGLVPL
jgi:mRNA interferase MazF